MGPPLRLTGVRWLVVLCMAGSTSACQGDPPPQPAPPPAAPAPKDDAPKVWCPAGLLCEAAEPVLGWRVPVACVVAQPGRYGATCVIDGVPLAAVAEFFESRYPGRVSQRGVTLEVSLVAKPLHTPPRIRGLSDGQQITLRLMRGD